MLEDGVATAQDIDATMELGRRHASGPLRTTDIVGLGVRPGIAEYLHQTLGERFAPPRILRDMVARGELGRKSGKGFYDYSRSSPHQTLKRRPAISRAAPVGNARGQLPG